MLKTCLCYDTTTDLLSLVRNGASEKELAQAMAEAIYGKPFSHCFTKTDKMTEYRMMNQIGG